MLISNTKDKYTGNMNQFNAPLRKFFIASKKIFIWEWWDQCSISCLVGRSLQACITAVLRGETQHSKSLTSGARQLWNAWSIVEVYYREVENRGYWFIWPTDPMRHTGVGRRFIVALSFWTTRYQIYGCVLRARGCTLVTVMGWPRMPMEFSCLPHKF